MRARRRTRWLAAVAGTGGGLLLSACSSSGATLPQQVGTWARTTGFSGVLSTLREDLAHVDEIGDHDGASLRTACDVLVTDTLDANQQLPSPDGQLTTLLAGAYAAAANAGHDCFSGAGGDTALLARSASERAHARTGLIEAEARYDAVVSTVPGRTS